MKLRDITTGTMRLSAIFFDDHHAIPIGDWSDAKEEQD